MTGLQVEKALETKPAALLRCELIMHTFIDESGTFGILDERKPHVCCVAALVVASSRVDALLRDFVAVRGMWPEGQREVKGSKLNEKEVAEAIGVAIKHDALLEICAVDTGRHSLEQVAAARTDQANKLRAAVGPQHHPNLVRQINEMATEWERLSHQLVVQLYATVHVVAQVIEHAPTYFVQRIPAELGSFRWILDRKDIERTPYETLWTQMVCPFLQTMSLESPFPRVEGFDYSHMNAFRVSLEGFPHLQAEMEQADARIRDAGGRVPTDGIDVVKLVRDGTVFENSADSLGLQLVDILANAFCRSMNDRLGKDGWQGLGRLMIRQNDRPAAPFIEIALPRAEPKELSGRQTRILNLLKSRTKSMLT